MSQDEDFKEPFNLLYLIAALVVLLSLPLMHVVIGWFVFFFQH